MPLGCFTVALLFLAFVGSILVIVFGAMKSTDVYKEALARAKTDPAVIEALGTPIEDGFLMSGNTNVNGASGESNLAIPISGPKGKATIYVSANKHLGDGIIRDLSWKSAKRINASIFFKSRCRPIHLDFVDGSCAQKRLPASMGRWNALSSKRWELRPLPPGISCAHNDWISRPSAIPSS